MKTDVIFYEIFREFPSIFFELLGQPETNANAYQFSSPEIKQLSFRLDGVFSPLAENSTEPLYFVEVQFYKDEKFYDRLFASIFLYFHQYQPTCPDWYAIVIYQTRRHSSTLPLRYNGIAPRHLREIYLDELGETPQSLGIGIVKLVIESGNPAKELAQQLVVQVKQELTDTIIREKVLQFIETIVLYKFPSLTPKEIEAMLSVSLLKETRVYQEIKEETSLDTKLGLVPKLLQKGMSIQEIAELLELDEETVRKAAK